MSEWKRPDSITIPTVWARFEGKKNVNGVRRKYWIQDCTENYFKEVLHHMVHGFITEVPLGKYAGIAKDPQSVEDYMAVWQGMLNQKISLICLTENEQGYAELVGFNLLAVSCKGKSHLRPEMFKGKGSQSAGNVLLHIYGLKDLFTELSVSTYLSALGLYVLPKFRGDGIALEILKARKYICLAIGLNVTVTGFASLGGQRLAEKDGYKDIVECVYTDLEKINPLIKLPGIENSDTKTFRLMYKRY